MDLMQSANCYFRGTKSNKLLPRVGMGTRIGVRHIPTADMTPIAAMTTIMTDTIAATMEQGAAIPTLDVAITDQPMVPIWSSRRPSLKI